MLWKIKTGIGCKLSGNTVIYLNEGVNVKIRSKCMFVSNADNLNLIGCNRPCIIWAQKKGAIIEIGDDNDFSGTVIGVFKMIKIGNNLKAGANTLIIDSNWHAEDYRSGEPKEVLIGNNVWLGVNTVVLKGVNLGNNALIRAISLVTKDIPPDAIAAGNPC